MSVCSNDSDSGQFVNSGVWESDFVKKDVSFILNDAIDKHLIEQVFDDDIFQFLKIASDCVQPYPYQIALIN
ncbi:hypothetical protein M0R45_008260 [Rubus argutus]|uniref:Uncharacterized protein n=1 Tax=Rubus argutus TaxID=59490 RepID=A0AAW1Y1P7_RUBAR